MIGESLLGYKISLVEEFKANQLDKIIVAVSIRSVLKEIKSILHEKGFEEDYIELFPALGE